MAARDAYGRPAPRPYLYLLLDAERPTADSVRFALGDVTRVVMTRGDRLRVRRADDAEGPAREIEVPDAWMSSVHARLVRDSTGWVVQDAGSKNGTVVNGETTTEARLRDGDVVELGHTFFLYREQIPQRFDEPPALSAAELRAPAPGLETFVTEYADELSAISRVAATDVAVLILGETGTGKEVIARAVHALSGRPGSFVPVNCGALPRELVESELFGHRKGAFSGATEDAPGLIRSADGGTLFLDEVGDLPLSSQAAFLRVLQEREVTPVGMTRPLRVDLRLVSATHHELSERVQRGAFRSDLHARLTGLTIRLPPLRARREDLGLLMRILLRLKQPARADRVRLTREAVRRMLAYAWPQNIRELERCLETAVILAGDGPVDVPHLLEPLRLSEVGSPTQPRAARPGDSDDPLRQQLIALFAEHKGNVSAVARAMGKARMQIQRWLKRYGIDPSSFKE